MAINHLYLYKMDMDGYFDMEDKGKMRIRVRVGPLYSLASNRPDKSRSLVTGGVTEHDKDPSLLKSLEHRAQA
jgi:hypothetical protein